jgi:hypothetical protein
LTISNFTQIQRLETKKNLGGRFSRIKKKRNKETNKDEIEKESFLFKNKMI